MGNERDKLIRSLGEIPISDLDLSDEELMALALESYRRRGRLPPDVEALRREMILNGERPALLVGYGIPFSPTSPAFPLGSRAGEKAPIPVVVEGYQRLLDQRASYCESGLDERSLDESGLDESRPDEPGFDEPAPLRLEDQPEVGALNVRPSSAHRFNGLAFRVTLEELEALDEREEDRERVWVRIRVFPDGLPLGEAFAYAGAPRSSAIRGEPQDLRQRWKEVALAREGAYAVSREFGEMFDSTTFLADGRSLLVQEYRR